MLLQKASLTPEGQATSGIFWGPEQDIFNNNESYDDYRAAVADLKALN